MTNISDRAFDIMTVGVFWPFTIVQGRHWLWRLLALTIGWVWIVPAMIVIGLPCVVVGIAYDLWDSLGEEEPK